MANISDNEVTDMMLHIDDQHSTDSGFFEGFTKALFDHFGWTYFYKHDRHETGDVGWDEVFKKTVMLKGRGLIAGYAPNPISKYIVLLQSGRYEEAMDCMYKDMEKYKEVKDEQRKTG